MFTKKISFYKLFFISCIAVVLGACTSFTDQGSSDLEKVLLLDSFENQTSSGALLMGHNKTLSYQNLSEEELEFSASFEHASEGRQSLKLVLDFSQGASKKLGLNWSNENPMLEAESFRNLNQARNLRLDYYWKPKTSETSAEASAKAIQVNFELVVQNTDTWNPREQIKAQGQTSFAWNESSGVLYLPLDFSILQTGEKAKAFAPEANSVSRLVLEFTCLDSDSSGAEEQKNLEGELWIDYMRLSKN